MKKRILAAMMILLLFLGGCSHSSLSSLSSLSFSSLEESESSSTPDVLTHTVFFNSTGGSEIISQTIEDGQFAAEPEKPIRSGYAFGFWDYEGTRWSFSENAVIMDIVLVAVWDKSTTGLSFELSDDGYVVTGGFDMGSDVVIPSEYNGKPVTGIADHAFNINEYSGYGIKSITIPDSVTWIGDYAFYYCRKLKTVSFARRNLVSIGSYAFAFCHALTSVVIPEYVENLGDHAFYDCESLTSVRLPVELKEIHDFTFGFCNSLTTVTGLSALTEIGSYSLYHCSSLASLHLPATVSSIKDNALSGCESLITIYYAGTKNQWNAIEIDEDWLGDPDRADISLQVIICLNDTIIY